MKTFSLRFVLIILMCTGILAALAVPCHAKVISIDESLKNVIVGQYMEYLEDKEGRLSFKDIKGKQNEGRWISSQKENLGFGFTKSVYWARFTIKNNSDKDIQFFLEQSYPLIDHMELYVPGESGYNVTKVGDLKPFSERPYKHKNFVFPLILKAETSGTYYIHQRTDSSMQFNLTIWSPDYFREMSSTEYYLLMIFYGIVFIMSVYNLVIFFFVKKIEYLYFFGCALGLLFVLSTQNGMAFQFLWPNSPWWGNICLPPFIAFYAGISLLFIIKPLDIKINFPILYKIGMIYVGIFAVSILLNFFFPYKIMIVLVAGVGFGAVTYADIIVIAMVLKRNRTAYIFLSAFLLIIIGLGLWILMLFGVLPSNLLTNWSHYLGAMFAVLLLAIALADRINVMSRELAVLNNNLEEKVRQRTEELQSAMEELEAMNNVLVETNSNLEEAQRIAKRDMTMATNVQTTLFPIEPPVTDNWDIAFTFKPMSGVSGDFYDFYVTNKELKGISIFDVSGHGIASGLITMIARSVFFRNFNNGTEKKLNEVIQDANRDLINEMGEVDNYLTGILLRFKDDVVEYVNAGHSDLLYKNAQSVNVRAVKREGKDIKGMFLGLAAVDAPYESLSFEVSGNDALILYTDCIYESKNAGGDEYGLENLIASIKSAPDGSAYDIQNHILNEFYSFLGDSPPGDDLTLIVVKRK